MSPARRSGRRLRRLSVSELDAFTNPVVTARMLGVRVSGSRLPAGVVAALLAEAGRDPHIVIGDDDARQRKRWHVTLALGLHLHDIQAGAEVADHVITLADSANFRALDAPSAFALDFARGFLLPRCPFLSDERAALREALPPEAVRAMRRR